jgi:hypothetical protein
MRPAKKLKSTIQWNGGSPTSLTIMAISLILMSQVPRNSFTGAIAVI